MNFFTKKKKMTKLTVILFILNFTFTTLLLSGIVLKESREMIFTLLITALLILSMSLAIFHSKKQSFFTFTFLFIALISFPLIWFLDNGIDGPAPFMFTVIFLIGVISFRKRMRIFQLTLLITIFVTLITLEKLRPDLLYRCSSLSCVNTNKLAGLIIFTFAIIFVSFTFFRRLEKEEENSSRYAYYVSRENSKLKELANTDQLTQLPNRRNIEEKIRYQYKVSRRKKRKFSFMMIDIDDFKQVNDRYGHLAGDFILKEIAKIIKRNIRDQDTPSRWGGEEFLILLPECNARRCATIAERIRKAVYDHSFIYRNMVIKLTVSIGVSEHDFRYPNPRKYIERADRAMYISKAKGKNMVTVVA